MSDGKPYSRDISRSVEVPLSFDVVLKLLKSLEEVRVLTRARNREAVLEARARELERQSRLGGRSDTEASGEIAGN